MDALPDIDYAAHPAYGAMAAGDPAQHEQAVASVAQLLQSKLDTLRESEAVFRGRAASSPDPVVGELALHGAAGVRLERDLLDRLRQAVSPIAGVLQGRLRERVAAGLPLRYRDVEADICLVGPEAAAGPGSMLEQLISATGVLDIARAYYPGSRAKLHGACVRRNLEAGLFHAAREEVRSRTSGMHIDTSGRPTFNGVIYLNEVGPDQGPFSYVAGSNRWRWDLEDRAMRKAIGEARFPTAADELFMHLPAEMRRKANFGHDVLDGSAASHAMLAGERVFCSDSCDMALFDSEGVHRGGDVRSGHRLSVLFIVKISPGASAHG